MDRETVSDVFANEPLMKDAPTWYQSRSGDDIDCMRAIKSMLTEEQFEGFCLGCAMKYIWRWQDKGGVNDIRKAIDYLTKFTEEEDGRFIDK